MASSQSIRPPTIHDVARVAKLSKSTVSNVIRDAVGVHPTTRERVRAAITELGYQTNIVARQLVQRKTTMLGIVIGELTNPFHAEMAKLIEELAASYGYQVMFCNTRADREVELGGIRSMLEHRVAGLLFLDCKDAAERARHLIPARVPAIFVACSADWGDVVAVDEVAGARAATDYLIDQGHRRIWHLTEATETRPVLFDRARGYAEAMRAAGLPATSFALGSTAGTVVIAQEQRSLIDILNAATGPTAVFAATDALALQIMGLAERLGRPVPAALSVIGFDDACCAGHARLGLTTIAQPKRDLARRAVETLVRRVAGDRPDEPSRQLLDFELMVRSSTAPLGRVRQPARAYAGLASA